MFRYAVVGDPVSHSKSPLIHSLFAEQTGEDISYVAKEVDAQSFDDFVVKFFAGGGSGLNVTLPHKERANKIAKYREPRADNAGAVNTLFVNEEGEICGDNTDGPGLITDIKYNNGIGLGGKNILLVGAGGAIRGVLVSLIEEKPAAITIVNRTIAKAAALKSKFSNVLDIEISDYENLHGSFDLIINGTSLGITGEVPPLCIESVNSQTCCYDMMYGNKDTAFVAWAKDKGASKVFDGLGMLVEQAAESFLRWRGVRPQTGEIIKALRRL